MLYLLWVDSLQRTGTEGTHVTTEQQDWTDDQAGMLAGSDVTDETTPEQRLNQIADTAVKAAAEAVYNSYATRYGNECSAAKIEAAGRIAAALIMNEGRN